MGFEILPFEKEDEDKYGIITITNPERWHPHKFQTVINHASKDMTACTKGSINSEVASSTPLKPKNTSNLLDSMT